MHYLNEIISNIRIIDIIDITIVAFATYKFYNLIKDTRAEVILKGILMLVIASVVSGWLKLYTTYYILDNALKVGVIAILIVFQPELRRALERIGSTSILSKSFKEVEEEYTNDIINNIVEAVASLSRQKIGGLLVFERETGLNEVVETGSKIGGNISSGLLINIFIPNTPLHDGAVIIKKDVIKAAGCLLPLSENMSLNRELGTRHRAAIGITESSDSLAIIISEETGAISVADSGKITRFVDINTLKIVLNKYYYNKDKQQGLISRWWSKNEEK